MPQNRIRLYQTKDGWLAVFDDPKIKARWGTDTLPTAFTARAVASVVLAEIERLNPESDVQIAQRITEHRTYN